MSPLRKAALTLKSDRTPPDLKLKVADGILPILRRRRALSKSRDVDRAIAWTLSVRRRALQQLDSQTGTFDKYGQWHRL